jgi:hypothetical protein
MTTTPSLMHFHLPPDMIITISCRRSAHTLWLAIATSKNCCAEVAATGDLSPDLPDWATLSGARIPDKLRLKAGVSVSCDELAQEQNAALA